MTDKDATPPHIDKFQQLLRELFQFDCADLDFGIYRIMNFKRDAIEEFITADLPQTVANELEAGPLAQQVRAAQELDKAAQEVRETLGDYIDAEGNLDDTYHETEVGKKYLNAREKAAGGAKKSRENVEASIFNHLYTFFSRYYQDGDFISKRRYSKRHRYAIPYNGEEVYLHWANSDQYYIKTAEHFHDYTWKAPNDVTVHFKLLAANVEQNNVKGEKRFFLPRAADTAWDPGTAEIIIPFEYRPLTRQEEQVYGNRKQQDNIIAEAVTEIPLKLDKALQAQAALTRERDRNDKGEVITYLKYHLRQYTRRNTSDFFIHKDLKGFLARELDFYLKNEVLSLDEMENAGQDMADGWFQMLRLIKSVGSRIIDFLDQIESFQKMLWEKRKFVVETQYCIAVGSIDAGFYPDIAVCDGQWDEWEDQFGVDEEQSDLFSLGTSREDRRIDFLRTHPTLVLDTRYFEQEFVDRLLARYEDLDGTTDGLCVHSDNWQALNVVTDRYVEQIKCVYIDPPYNTAASEIIYKNGYKHSSWISLMADRMFAASSLVNRNAAWVVAIDDTEMVSLSNLLDVAFPAYDRNVVVVNHHPAGSGLEGTNVSSTHEYALFMTPVGVRVLRGEKKTDGVNEIGLVRTGTATSNLRIGRENSFYAFLVDPVTSTIIGVEPPPPLGEEYPTSKTPEGYVRIYPVGNDGTERVWRRSYKTVHACIERGEIVCKNGRSMYLVTTQFGKRRPVFSNWMAKKYNAGTYGSNLLKDIFGEGSTFSYPKSINTVRDCIEACIHDLQDANVLDYFAGSGTTGHAVINLNREDGGQRKFILVEMGDHFDTVLLPRIKKVTFTPEWQYGKPKRMATPEEAERSPRIVKYIRLESYEDALNNIKIDDHAGQAAMRFGFDDYLLKYMLSWETKQSETFLNVEKLVSPFSYQLNVHADGQTRARVADVPETFNYLLGLIVRTRRVYDDDGRRYLVYQGEIRDNPGQVVAVIWRETAGWSEAGYERDSQFVAENGLVEGADLIYVNGDSFIPNAKALEPLFKARMFAGIQS